MCTKPGEGHTELIYALASLKKATSELEDDGRGGKAEASGADQLKERH